MKRSILSVTIFIASAIILSSCSHEQHREAITEDNPIAVTLATAGKKPAHTIQGSGQITAGETAMISTRIMGFITGVSVRPGDTVKKGQLLVTISNSDILARRAQAGALVSETEAALKDAQKDYERYTELFKQQSASQKELENITLNYNAVRAKAEAAKQMQNEADAMLAYTYLTAPFSGVVTQKNLDAGSMANPGAPILVVERSGNFQVNTSVTEADIDQIRIGAETQIVIESIGKVLTGKVLEVSPSSQLTGGQYQIKVSIPDTEKGGLHSGMYARVLINSSGSFGNDAAAVMVPVQAIITNDQLNGLYTVSDAQTALLRWVRLGEKHGDHIEVLSGLTADESFILTAEGKLYNGVPVVVK